MKGIGLVLVGLMLIGGFVRAQEPAPPPTPIPSPALQQAVTAQQIQDLQNQLAELQRRIPSPQQVAQLRAQIVVLKAAADKRLCDALHGRFEADIQNGQIAAVHCWVRVK